MDTGAASKRHARRGQGMAWAGPARRPQFQACAGARHSLEIPGKNSMAPGQGPCLLLPSGYWSSAMKPSPRIKPNPAGGGLSIGAWKRIRHRYPQVKFRGRDGKPEAPIRNIKLRPGVKSPGEVEVTLDS